MSIKSSKERRPSIAHSGAAKPRSASKDGETYDPATEQLRKGKGSSVGGVDRESTNDHGSLTGLGDDDHTQYTRIYSGSGSPSGVVTPARIGCMYVDTSGNIVYVSYGTTNTSWAQLN